MPADFQMDPIDRAAELRRAFVAAYRHKVDARAKFHAMKRVVISLRDDYVAAKVACDRAADALLLETGETGET